MSGKSDYKKINSNWNSNMKDEKLRKPIEKEEIQFKSEDVEEKHKKLKRTTKNHKKPSDHKHSYEIVLVRYDNDGAIHSYGLRRRCSICGRIDSGFWRKIQSHDEFKLRKEVIVNGISLYESLSEEEILKKFANYKMITSEEVKPLSWIF